MRRFLVVLLLVGLFLGVSGSLAHAQEAKTAEGSLVKFGLAIASGFGLAIAASFGALSQGRATAAALEGIARNPSASGRLFVPMIIGLALIESLVLYMFAIAFLLQNKL
ncbi:MAG: ATP synthase F0 subunit C [Candidatus Tectomicrobia bacterium]|uniref:ATP synthase subunit c n=1 Tax=Tectimicrobiota bacterium TaxID=2528274 RepID=A0A932GN71_UNCTE|nr:ATP synthase F0 subunit C [Candidatus Tectomicrobia bacterium]